VKDKKEGGYQKGITVNLSTKLRDTDENIRVSVKKVSARENLTQSIWNRDLIFFIELVTAQSKQPIFVMLA
jgi:hypothetical protein